MDERRVLALLESQFASRTWRLHNLYWITDKAGAVVKFAPNWAQTELLESLHTFNLVLKSRQLGFTTLIDLILLDAAVFNSNIRAGIIAHNLDDAKVIFRDKVRFPYERLPDGIREARAARTEREGELLFSNNSSIRVATSMRSGTVQFLHVSEMGKIAAKYPEKAREIKAGAFPAVPLGGAIFVESTAEGRSGAFYELCKESQDQAREKRALGPLDFKFHFFPWWKHPEYRTDPDSLTIHPKLAQYFEGLLTKQRIRLDDAQKAWYVAMQARLGEDVKREYPATPEEAFEASIEGAYFSRQMAKLREDGRLTKVPHQEHRSVDTWWDLGVDDYTAIWFTQDVGREIHVIDYYQGSDEGLDHYVNLLDDWHKAKGYRYGRHVGPHDLMDREWGNNGKSRLSTAQAKGIKFDVVPAPKEKANSIEAARNFLGQCVIDAERCAEGVECLDNYRKAWNEQMGVYRETPMHDAYSHGADAFQVLARGHSFKDVPKTSTKAPPSWRAWT